MQGERVGPRALLCRCWCAGSCGGRAVSPSQIGGGLGVPVAWLRPWWVTTSWPGLGREDVAHDVDLAESAIGFPVCFEYIVQNSSYGIFAGHFDDPLQWPCCCVVAPCLLVVLQVEDDVDLVPALDGEAGLGEQVLDDALVTAGEWRRRSGRWRCERAQPSKESLGFAALGVAPDADRYLSAGLAHAGEFLDCVGRVGGVLDRVERGDDVERCVGLLQ